MTKIEAFRAALAGATMLAAGAAVLPAPALAQVGQAALRGTIRSTPDNPVQQVTIVDTQSGFRLNSTVGANGAYNFPSLRPSTYRLEIVTERGTRNSDEFTLITGQNAGLDIDLSTAPTQPAVSPDGNDEEVGAAPVSPPVGGADDEIIVTGNRIRSLQGGQVGINITQRLIEQLPQNSRNFLAFADLAPGVRFLEEGGGNTRIQGGAQRSNSVNVFIDGVSQKDYVLRGGITGQDSTPGNPFPQLAVGEYQVLSSNYKAEFDQVSSVAITATTRSGTNRFEGEGFYDFTNTDLRAPTPFEIQNGTQVDQTQMQFGGSLGGPIIPDVLHFFASYEGKRLDLPVDIFPNQGVAIDSLPPQYRDIFGAFTQRFNQDMYFGKLSFQPTSRDLFEVTGKYRRETGDQIGSGNAAFSTRTIRGVDELRILGRWQHSADNWINDLRVDYQDVEWNPRPVQPDIRREFFRTLPNADGTFNRFPLFIDGGGSNFQNKGQRGTIIQDDFTYTGLDNHTFKVGTKFGWLTLNTLEQNNINGFYQFDADFGPGGFNEAVPFRLQFGAPSGFSNPVVEARNFQLGFYAQDDWDVNDRLTLNIGLRWDFERNPAFLNFVTPQVNLDAISPANYPNLVNADYDINDYISTGNNRSPFLGAWQPRLGFTYRFDDEGRLTAFGGYGRSYDRNQFDFLQQELTVGSFQQRTFLFQGANVVDQCVPSATCIPWDPIYLTPEGRAQLATGTVGGGRELRFIRNDLRVPYSDQFSLGLRSRVDTVELEAGYTHIASRDGFVYLLGNRRPDGRFFAPGPTPQQPNPESPFQFTPSGFGSILIGDNGLETNADSVYFKLTKPFSAASPWSLDATYTFTEATENRAFGETFSLDFASIDDYATLRSVGVPRHRFVTAGSVDLPIGLTLSAKFQIESPLYQIAFVPSSVPFERQQVGAFRNSLGDVWGRRQLDFAATKYVRFPFISDGAQVRFRVDIINLMNDRNFIDFNNDPLDNTRTPGSPTIYGERSTIAIGGNPPRTIKLSAGFNF